MKERSPSPEQEKKRRHTQGGKWLPSEDILEGGRKKQIIRGAKRGHEMDGSTADPNTKKGKDESRQEKFRELITSSESDETFDMDSEESTTTTDEDINKLAQTPEQLDIELLSSTNPFKGSEGAAGWDLQSNQTLMIGANTWRKVDLGMRAVIPPTHCRLLVSRSHLASEGITVVGGLIDSDYRGPWIAILQNSSDQPRRIIKGERICQLVVLPVPQVDWLKVTSLDQTNCGQNGFGSTGHS